MLVIGYFSFEFDLKITLEYLADEDPGKAIP